LVLQERARATRESIIFGAAKVFEERGYGTSSISLVAEEAEVTKGALYFHFKSKDELARAVVEEQHVIVVRAGEGILEQRGTALSTMIRLCAEFGYQLATDRIVRAGIRLTLEASAFGHKVRDPYEDWTRTMVDLAERGMQAGHIRTSIEPDALARYIVASFTGVQMVSNVLTGREDVMARIQQMWEILLPGIMHEDSTEDVHHLVDLVPKRWNGQDFVLPASA
jgi:AcrR family transcriptional regulator